MSSKKKKNEESTCTDYVKAPADVVKIKYVKKENVKKNKEVIDKYDDNADVDNFAKCINTIATYILTDIISGKDIKTAEFKKLVEEVYMNIDNGLKDIRKNIKESRQKVIDLDKKYPNHGDIDLSRVIYDEYTTWPFLILVEKVDDMFKERFINCKKRIAAQERIIYNVDFDPGNRYLASLTKERVDSEYKLISIFEDICKYYSIDNYKCIDNLVYDVKTDRLLCRLDGNLKVNLHCQSVSGFNPLDNLKLPK